jgi:hypothetical protein
VFQVRTNQELPTFEIGERPTLTTEVTSLDATSWQQFGGWKGLFSVLYCIGIAATFIYLTFLDGVPLRTWLNLILVPLNAALSTVWPFYWLILRPLHLG